MEFVNLPTDVKVYISQFIDLQDLFSWIMVLSTNRKCKETCNSINKKKILGKFSVDTTKPIKMEIITHVTIVNYKFNITKVKICPICHRGDCITACEDCEFYSCGSLGVIKMEPIKLDDYGNPALERRDCAKRCRKCSKFRFNHKKDKWERRIKI